MARMAAITPTARYDDRIVPAEYPQLRRLVWNRNPNQAVSGAEALQIYEAAWLHVDEDAMTPEEKALVKRLAGRYGNGHLLVRR